MEVAGGIRRGEVFLMDLNPTRGGESRKTRPCVVVSPDELNTHLRTFIVAPLTTGGHQYPYRIACHLGGKSGYGILDQIRTGEQERWPYCKRCSRREQRAILRVP